MGLLQRCSDILERYNKMFVSFQNSKNTIPFSFQQLHRILNKFGVLHLGLYVNKERKKKNNESPKKK